MEEVDVFNKFELELLESEESPPTVNLAELDDEALVF